MAKDIEWRGFYALIPRKTLEGETVRGDCMRRRVKGVWYYRPMTEEEASEHFASDCR